MNYVQVEIGGRLRGLKFNNYGIEQMLLKQNGSASDVEGTYAMFWGGLKGNSYAKEEEVDYTFGDVVDWVDELGIKENGAEEIAKVLKAMTESQLYKKYVTDKPNKGEKKSQPKASSVKS